MPSLANVLAASLQILVIVAAATAASVLLRSAPHLRYGLWRGVLALSLILPWLQTPKPTARAIVSADSVAAVTSAAASAPASAGLSGAGWTMWLAVLIVSAILARAVWIAVGYALLRRLRAAGAPAPISEHGQLQAALNTAADVRYVPALRQPVTFGVLRPVVLLPETLQEHPAPTRQAVIAHELVHVRRRDWVWLLAEELVRTVLCFHPAIWWLVSRVQAAREEVVDSTVVALTGRRREYLAALLAFADDVPLAPAPAFARRRHLFRRIVLLSTEEVMSTRRLVASGMIVVGIVIAASWWSMQIFPTYAQSSPALQSGIGPLERVAQPIGPANPMPARVFQVPPEFPPELDGQEIAVTVTLRTVVDGSGSVREVRPNGLSVRGSGFTATLDGAPDFMQRLEMMMKASLRAAPGQTVGLGSLHLNAFFEAAVEAVQQWRYEPPRQSPIAFDTTLKFESGAPVSELTTTPAQRARTADGALRVGGNIKPPPKIKDVRPVYPQEARDAGVQGVVILELRIETDGRVGNAEVLRSIPMLDAAALNAALQWEFTPTLLNGQPVPVLMTVTIQFSM